MPDKLRLMIIDDEPIVGKRLKRLLEKDGYNVEAFTGGTPALEALEKQHFDIIITDLMMGRIDGMKVLETAKNKNPDIKVIIITGFGKKETADEALNKGAFDFIIKPFKFEELHKVVKKAETELKAKDN
ncbi:MAG: response regulator [Nitrospirae bacterium]|nr:response regulator [Nitrospirota bacterium]